MSRAKSLAGTPSGRSDPRRGWAICPVLMRGNEWLLGGFMKASRIHLILRPSRIQGIGVFTLTSIKKGERIPLSNPNDARIIQDSELARLPKAYCQYHVPDVEGNWWAPINYHCMSIGWYL